MPAPYDYTTPQVNVSSYFDAFRQGRADKRQMEAETRQDNLRKYLGPAYQGDKAAQAEVMNIDPEAGMNLQTALQGASLQKLQIAKAQNDAIANLVGSVRDGDAAGFEAAKQRAVSELGIDPQMVSGLTVQDLPRLRLQSGQTARELDAALQRAQIDASRASADASRSLANQRTAGGAALPPRLQTAEDEDIGAIQTVQSINAQLDAIEGQIDSGELDLGPVNNLISRGMNYAGASNEGSINFATMMSTLEKMRNDSLILNKGVQTEGDAVRAWNALIANVNDPDVVKAQIARIKKLNEIAAAQKEQLINVRRTRNNAPPFDPSQIALPGGGGAPAPAAPSGTPIVKTQAEFDALPSGTVYVEPDGKRYRKP
jgi:hypothetical protein